MLKKEKTKIVNELKEKFSRSTIIVTTDYRGLSAKEMTELRRHLAKIGVEYRVVKNTLARFAAIEVGKEQLEPFFSGPVAIALSYDDGAKLAKTLDEYIRSSGSILQIKGGILGSRVLGPGDISTLSTLPSREILVSQVIGQMRVPLQALHNVLAAPLRGVLAVLQGRINQLKGDENARRAS